MEAIIILANNKNYAPNMEYEVMKNLVDNNSIDLTYPIKTQLVISPSEGLETTKGSVIFGIALEKNIENANEYLPMFKLENGYNKETFEAFLVDSFSKIDKQYKTVIRLNVEPEPFYDFQRFNESVAATQEAK